jgi:hypothetical protein
MSIRARLRETYKSHFLGGLFSQHLFDEQGNRSPIYTHCSAVFMALFALFLAGMCVFAVRIDDFYKMLALRGVYTVGTITDVKSKPFKPLRSDTVKYRIALKYKFSVNGAGWTGSANFEEVVPPVLSKGGPITVIYDGQQPARNTVHTTLSQWHAKPNSFIIPISPAIVMLLFWLVRYGRWWRTRCVHAGPNEAAPCLAP